MRITLGALILAAAVHGAEGLEQALARFEEGKFREALEAAEAVPAESEDFAKSRYLMGEIHLVLDEAADAEKALQAALAKKAGSEPILTALGRALLDQERVDEATEVLRKAVEAGASSARARTFLGIAHLRAGESKEGEKEVAAGLKLGADDPEVVRAVVLERLRTDDLAAARKAARAFALSSRKHPMGPFLLGLVAERAKEYDDAIEAYTKAAKLDDTFVDAHKNLAILCIAQNPMYQNAERTGLAMTHFQRYVDLGGEDKEVLRIFETLKQFVQSGGR